MIPDIGLIIAAYTITRFMNILSTTETRLVMKIFSLLGMFITCIALIDLLEHSVPAGMR